MKQWLRRVRGAVGLGVTWALVWAPIAVIIGFIVDPDGSLDEMWPLIGAYPGFLGGVLFSILLGVAARHRRLDELSVPRAAAWGALAGLMVGSLPFLLGDSNSSRLWLLATVVIGTITLLSAASAAGSLALAQRAGRRAMGDARPDSTLPPPSGARPATPAASRPVENAATARRSAQPDGASSVTRRITSTE